MRASAPLLAALLLATGAAQAEETPPPSRALLEFLGSFETADGKWIDPTRLPPPQPTPTAPAADAEAEEKNDD